MTRSRAGCPRSPLSLRKPRTYSAVPHGTPDQVAITVLKQAHAVRKCGSKRPCRDGSKNDHGASKWLLSCISSAAASFAATPTGIMLPYHRMMVIRVRSPATSRHSPYICHIMSKQGLHGGSCSHVHNTGQCPRKMSARHPHKPNRNMSVRMTDGPGRAHTPTELRLPLFQ